MKIPIYLLATAMAATIPSDAWTGLKPNELAPAGAVTSYSGSFGIQIVVEATNITEVLATTAAGKSAASKVALVSVTSSASKAKRADPVAQINDGQVQNPTAKPTQQPPLTLAAVSVAKPTAQAVSQITDGQVQQPTAKPATVQAATQAPKPAANPVQQITDGQVQQPTAKPTQQLPTLAAASKAPAPQAAAPQAAQPVQQINDGQVQNPTAHPVQQINDGQVQNPTAHPVQQINDGQVQNHPATAVAVQQINDGQVQNHPATAAAVAHPTAAAVQQINDGQVQNSHAAAPTVHPTAAAVSQIHDGQPQNPTAAAPVVHPTAAAVSQIHDGQPQNLAAAPLVSHALAAAVSQIHDGQPQNAHASASGLGLILGGIGAGESPEPALAEGNSTTSTGLTGTSNATDGASVFDTTPQACKSNSSLTLTLKDGILRDSKGRVGSIVSNRQFQFDGPPPQAGAIYANGFSITKDGYIALGSSDKFWQCLSGDFYNLYDRDIGTKCYPVKFQVIKFVDC